MPGWLGAIAEWNPLSATVAAVRDLFGNPGWQGDFRVAEHALLMVVLWPLLIVAVFFPLAVRQYRTLTVDRRGDPGARRVHGRPGG